MQRNKTRNAIKITMRSLFLLLLVCGLMVRFWILPALQQKRIAQWVVSHQGSVGYQEELSTAGKYREARYGLIGKTLGVDFVDRIAMVSLKKTDDLRVLSGLPHLQHLTVGQYMGSNLSCLEGLLHLESLTISGSDEVDLGALENLPSLSFLAFTNSETVDFSPLRNLRNLTHLDLYGTRLVDFEDLEDLTQLEWLFLPNSALQPADIIPLKKLVNLKSLCVGRTIFSEEGCQELQTALPNCHIEFYLSDD